MFLTELYDAIREHSIGLHFRSIKKRKVNINLKIFGEFKFAIIETNTNFSASSTANNDVHDDILQNQR